MYSHSFSSDVIFHFFFFKDTNVLHMEKDQTHKLLQYEDLQPDECIDWSLQSYEDAVSREEDGPKEPVAMWIIGKKRKHLAKMKLVRSF